MVLRLKALAQEAEAVWREFEESPAVGARCAGDKESLVGASSYMSEGEGAKHGTDHQG